MAKSRYKKARKTSSLEDTFIRLATKAKLPFEFEQETFTYVIIAKYTPDFRIGKGKFIETKGHFDREDRRKVRAFVEQYPKIKLYMLFGNADNKINAGSKTTYGMWATKYGIEWADIRQGLPTHWWKGSK